MVKIATVNTLLPVLLSTVETWYNKILGTKIFCLLYQIFCYISVVKKKKKKRKLLNSLGPENFVHYIRYFVISDLFINMEFPLYFTSESLISYPGVDQSTIHPPPPSRLM